MPTPQEAAISHLAWFSAHKTFMLRITFNTEIHTGTL